MDRGIHVGEGVAMDREHRDLEEVALGVGGPELRGYFPAEVGLDGKREVHDAHATLSLDEGDQADRLVIEYR
jgi:hypothetical protein